MSSFTCWPPAARGIRRNHSYVLGRRSSPDHGRFAPLGWPVFSSWPAALLGFGPPQLLSGRTVARHKRSCRQGPPVVRPLTLLLVDLVEVSAASNLPGIISRDCVRSGCAGFDFWAFTRPYQPSAASRLWPRIMLPWALPLSGLLDTDWCRLPGRSLGDGRWTGRTRPVDSPAAAIPLPVALRS